MDAANTAGKQRRGRPFASGQSGNPAGKKQGTRHRLTQLAEKLMQADAEAVVLAVVAKARDGDMGAAKFVLDRVLPAPPRPACPICFAVDRGCRRPDRGARRGA
jgi:Family of unknown function (DUF5681)